MYRILKSAVLVTGLIVSSVVNASLITVSTSSDLDFEGDFAYAINFAANGVGPTIGDASFTNIPLYGVGPGIGITGFNQTANAGLNLGTANSDLASIMSSLIWSAGLNPGNIDLDVTAGSTYRLQLMFGEIWSDPRDYNVYLESLFLAGTDDPVWVKTRGQGYAMVAYDFVAGDDTLNLEFLRGLRGDTNYYISALTLEDVTPVSEPTSIFLFLSTLYLVGLRRRK